MKLATKLRRYKKAKDEFLVSRIDYMCCDGCGRWDKPLSISHTISRARCAEIGKDELYYAKKNFELMCYYETGACHETWESGTLEQKKRLLNWDKMMTFVREHDEETFHKILEL